VTQSVPVYFIGYADKEFHTGDIVNPPPSSPCVAPSAEGVVAGQPQLGSFCGAYFGVAFDGPTAFVRPDAILNFDWRSKGPGGYWFDDAAQGFSARWSGEFAFPSVGTYAIGVIWSGAVIVSIDGVPVVERWEDQGQPAEVIVSRTMGAGIHQIDVQYRTTNGHGLLKLGWGRLLADEDPAAD
jgi:hypothetical protein